MFKEWISSFAIFSQKGKIIKIKYCKNGYLTISNTFWNKINK